MKNYILTSLIISSLGLFSLSTCSTSNSNNGNSNNTIPLCIQSKIDAILLEPVRNPPAKLYSYEFEGETVYYFPPHHGDFFSELYNASCTLRCHPDGGFTGMGDGNCPTFFSTRSNENLLWSDPR